MKIVERYSGDTNAELLLVQQENRDAIRASGLLGVFPDILSEFGGRQAPAWAFQSADVWWNELFSPSAHWIVAGVRNTFRDWTEPYLDLDAIRRDKDSFYSMWCDDAQSVEAPRNWMRWAVGFVQLGWKLSRSNGVDNQIASYLYDVDVFVTTDSRFAGVLKVTTAVAPKLPADVRYIPASLDGFWEGLATALER
ncbi:MAG: hypothetical protein WB565_14475 [Acidimicrobiales bacterium]